MYCMSRSWLKKLTVVYKTITIQQVVPYAVYSTTTVCALLLSNVCFFVVTTSDTPLASVTLFFCCRFCRT